MKTRTCSPVLFRAILLGALLALGVGLSTAAAVGPSTWYVGSAFDDGTCNVSHMCLTVQNAVNLAAAGDVVVVTPGTYMEQVDIGKNLTLVGAVGGTSIIKSPPTLATKFITGTNPNKPVVFAHDATVSIQYLTVDGDGKGNANYRMDGIAYHNAGGTVDHVTIVRIRETPASGTQHGVGLYAYNEDATARTLTVTNNTINDFQKNGMSLVGAGLTVNVSNNTVTGAGAISYTAQNGIQVSGGAAGNVGPNNVVSNISYIPSTYAAAGFLVYGDVVIHHNTVTDTQAGIYFVQGNGTITSNVINTTQGNVGTTWFWGILAVDPPHAVPSPFDAGAGVELGGGAGAPTMESLLSTLNISVANNTVTATGTSTDSIGLETDAGYAGTETMNVSMTGNSVSGWGYGVTAFQCTSGCTGSTFGSVSVNNNVIESNTVGLDANVTVDATKNWWGSTAGPGAGGNNGTGSGGGTMTTTPWATALTTSTTASTHEIGEGSTLQTNVTANGIYGAQLRVSHDASVLNGGSGATHDVGGFFWDQLVENFASVTSPTGTRVSGSMRADMGHPAGVNLTNANVATWNYTCANIGSSTLSYDTTAGLLGTKLADIDGFEIPSALLGDSVTCTAQTGSVSGAIELQGRLQNAPTPAGWNGSIVTLTCVPASGCDGFGPYVFATGVDGLYALTKAGAGTGIAAGTYNATAARRAYLTASKASVVVSYNGSLVMTQPKLKGGDVNNDNAIDISDLAAIGGVFGTAVTADTGPDVNGDGVVNIFDLVMAGGNYFGTATWP